MIISWIFQLSQSYFGTRIHNINDYYKNKWTYDTEMHQVISLHIWLNEKGGQERKEGRWKPLNDFKLAPELSNKINYIQIGWSRDIAGLTENYSISMGDNYFPNQNSQIYSKASAFPFWSVFIIIFFFELKIRKNFWGLFSKDKTSKFHSLDAYLRQ